MQRTKPKEDVLATALYIQESTIDLAMRMAKLLARRLGRPVYVGNSIDFGSTGLGGTVEEEMDGMRRCVEVVFESVRRVEEREKEDSEADSDDEGEEEEEDDDDDDDGEEEDEEDDDDSDDDNNNNQPVKKK